MNTLKLWLYATGFAALLGGSGQVFAYGALAIDHNQGPAYGSSYNHSSMRKAERAALRECGDDCQIVVRIESGCGAYAADQARGSTIFGYAFAKTGEGAQRRAMGFCREYGGRRCQVRAWACNSEY